MALSNGQVQEIQRILSERQLEVHRRYLEKREEIFRKLRSWKNWRRRLEPSLYLSQEKCNKATGEGLLRLKEEIGKLHRGKGSSIGKCGAIGYRI